MLVARVLASSTLLFPAPARRCAVFRSGGVFSPFPPLGGTVFAWRRFKPFLGVPGVIPGMFSGCFLLVFPQFWFFALERRCSVFAQGGVFSPFPPLGGTCSAWRRFKPLLSFPGAIPGMFSGLSFLVFPFGLFSPQFRDGAWRHTSGGESPALGAGSPRRSGRWPRGSAPEVCGAVHPAPGDPPDIADASPYPVVQAPGVGDLRREAEPTVFAGMDLAAGRVRGWRPVRFFSWPFSAWAGRPLLAAWPGSAVLTCFSVRFRRCYGHGMSPRKNFGWLRCRNVTRREWSDDVAGAFGEGAVSHPSGSRDRWGYGVVLRSCWNGVGCSVVWPFSGS